MAGWTQRFLAGLLFFIPLILLAAIDLEPRGPARSAKLIRIANRPGPELLPAERCLAAVLSTTNKTVDEAKIFELAGVDPELGRGASLRELARAARSLGIDSPLETFVLTESQLTQTNGEAATWIRHSIDRGAPVIANLGHAGTPSFGIINGYDAASKMFYVLSPTSVDSFSRQSLHEIALCKRAALPLESGRYEISLLPIDPAATTKLNIAEGASTDADYAEHVAELKKRLPSDDFQIVVQKPFVVIGDESPRTLRRRCKSTIEWAVTRLKQQYFEKDPERIVDVWLFKDRNSYEKNVERLFGRKPHTPFGYYSRSDRALVMNISTGGGTLVHEIVHPFIESNFPECPAWFNEGLASLYEQCRDRDGLIWGSTNWRLRGLQDAIRRDVVPPFRALCETSTREFYQEDPGTNYSQARYLCYYLQQHGLLSEFYHRFRDQVDEDPTGYETLKSVLGVDDMDEFQSRWQAEILELRFPD